MRWCPGQANPFCPLSHKDSIGWTAQHRDPDIETRICLSGQRNLATSPSLGEPFFSTIQDACPPRLMPVTAHWTTFASAFGNRDGSRKSARKEQSAAVPACMASMSCACCGCIGDSACLRRTGQSAYVALGPGFLPFLRDLASAVIALMQGLST